MNKSIDTNYFIEVGEWLNKIESELKEMLLNLDKGHINPSSAYQQIAEIKKMINTQKENLKELHR